MRPDFAVVLFLVLAQAVYAGEPVKDAPATPAKPAVASTPYKCPLLVRARLDMEMDDSGRITVPVAFNGVTKQIMLDTDAARSMISAHTVKELDLKPRQASRSDSLVGFGGTVFDQIVDIAEFGIGSMKGKDYRFVVDTTGMEAAGLLGGDFLYYFDLDLDFANAKLRLISPDHCPGVDVYWTKQGYGQIPFEFVENQIQVTVQLDGKDVVAILDTGAVDTVMSLERASRAFDIDRSALAKSRHYPFKTLSIGAVSVNAPSIELMPDRESGLMGKYESTLNMIIGMGVLRRLHLYVAYKEKMIYVTPATQY